jgi:hypothetical protein
MTLGDLLVLYGTAGVASGVVVYRSARRGRRALWGSLLAVPLWPLWLPVVLQAERRRSTPATAPCAATKAAIWEAHQAVLGSPLEALLPREAALRMQEEVERAGERHRELVELLEQPAFSPEAASRRIDQLTHEGASPRALAPARLHLENIERLARLRRRDEQTLAELRELCGTLRTQLVLARFEGSTPHDASDIVSDVWARVEVLGSTLESAERFAFSPSHVTGQAHPPGG